VGLLSERDYARKVILLGRVSKDTPARDIMTAEVVCVSPEQSVETCMGLMTQKHIRHLPVVVDDRLAGIISIGDVVKAVIEEHKFAIQQLEHYIMGHR
jgi:CBS domain-containing protein